MAELIKCKNCGAPIEYAEGSYYRHIRDVHTGRIWCFPTNDIETQDYTRAAEPQYAEPQYEYSENDKIQAAKRIGDPVPDNVIYFKGDTND